MLYNQAKKTIELFFNITQTFSSPGGMVTNASIRKLVTSVHSAWWGSTNQFNNRFSPKPVSLYQNYSHCRHTLHNPRSPNNPPAACMCFIIFPRKFTIKPSPVLQPVIFRETGMTSTGCCRYSDTSHRLPVKAPGMPPDSQAGTTCCLLPWDSRFLWIKDCLLNLNSFL